jgi:hypothetical protein
VFHDLASFDLEEFILISKCGKSVRSTGLRAVIARGSPAIG